MLPITTELCSGFKLIKNHTYTLYIYKFFQEAAQTGKNRYTQKLARNKMKFKKKQLTDEIYTNFEHTTNKFQNKITPWMPKKELCPSKPDLILYKIYSNRNTGCSTFLALMLTNTNSHLLLLLSTIIITVHSVITTFFFFQCKNTILHCRCFLPQHIHQIPHKARKIAISILVCMTQAVQTLCPGPHNSMEHLSNLTFKRIQTILEPSKQLL